MRILMRPTYVVFACSLFTVSPVFPQGSLTPPAAPTPTMKTLTQVEPRTDVQTLAGDASNQFIISQPGSYYLSANITGQAGKNGISIQADNVTIDLNGFALISTAIGSLNGIVVTDAHKSMTVRNGTARGWGGHGVAASATRGASATAIGCIFERLCVAANGGVGLLSGDVSTVRNCVADSNGVDGFLVGSGCTVEGSTALNNAVYGFHTQ